MRHVSILLAALLMLVVLPARGLAQAQAPAAAPPRPRYLLQMQAELEAMGLAPQCVVGNAQSGRCTFRAAGQVTSSGEPSAAPAPRFVVTLQYDDNTDTIYVYADHYATLHADAPNALAAFRRLLELNWEMLIGRFEWSSSTGEVRVSAVLNTDSNFDRRAFRGVVRSVLRLADRYAPEVARLTGSPVGEQSAAVGTGPAAASPAPATH